jgi:hypothetical protein
MEQSRRERILAIQARQHAAAPLGLPESPQVEIPRKAPADVVKALVRGTISKRQAADARALVDLQGSDAVAFEAARRALGRTCFEVVNTIVLGGAGLSGYGKLHGVAHYVTAERLRCALDVLAINHRPKHYCTTPSNFPTAESSWKTSGRSNAHHRALNQPGSTVIFSTMSVRTPSLSCLSRSQI